MAAPPVYLTSECLTQAWQAVQPTLGGTGLHALAPSSFRSNHIVDDGRGMFSTGGNRLYVRSNSTFNSGQNTRNGGYGPGGLDYNNSCGALQPTGVGDIEYSVCPRAAGGQVFAAIFYSPTASIEGFRVDGELGHPEALDPQWVFGQWGCDMACHERLTQRQRCVCG